MAVTTSFTLRLSSTRMRQSRLESICVPCRLSSPSPNSGRNASSCGRLLSIAYGLQKKSTRGGTTANRPRLHNRPPVPPRSLFLGVSLLIPTHRVFHRRELACPLWSNRRGPHG